MQKSKTPSPNAITKRPLSVIRLIVIWVLLTMLCSVCGCVASFFSARLTVAKDYTEEATVGVISYRGFPVWFSEVADGMRGFFYGGRFTANWAVWTAFFVLICCGLRFAFSKRGNKKKSSSSCECEDNPENSSQERS